MSAIINATETPRQAARRLFRRELAQGYRSEALHKYTAADGATLFFRARLRAADGSKFIRPFHLGEHGYQVGEPTFDEGKPLYHLHALEGAASVFVVEGEQCVDALAKLDIVATTSGSSSSAAGADWSPLSGRHVVIWPDADTSGARYAEAVLDKLRHIGAETVRVVDVRPLGLDESGDVVDWLKAHPNATADDVRKLATVEPPRQRPRVAAQRATLPAQPRWPTIDQRAYHGLAGDVVHAIEPHTEADPVALLVQFLAAFGNCVGRGPYYLVEDDRHYPNLFSVMVGQSSKARKGTSWGRIRRLFEAIESEQQWLSSMQSGLSSGEGLIWAVRDPVMGREKTGKGKDVHYLDVEQDPGVADKRLMVLESEFANVLRVLTREGNTLSRVIRDGWDRGDLATMTKNSPARATGAHVSIVGHVTDEELRRYLDRTEAANGFANRFIYVCVRRSKALPHGGSLTDADLQPLAKRLAVAIADARCMGRITMTHEAAHVWEVVYPDLSEGQPGLLGAITARAEAQVIRLALLYALLDGAPQIGPEHLYAALALWEYAHASAGYIFGATLGDPIADEIARALEQAGKAGMTRTEISRLFKGHRSSTQIGRALDLLAQHGRAHRDVQHGGGRPVEFWFAGEVDHGQAA